MSPLIYIPRIREVICEPRPALMVGRYRLQVHKPGFTTPRVDTGWFSNLLTDGGLDEMAKASDWPDTYAVGTGTTPPTENDTSMEAEVAQSSSQQGNSDYGSSSPRFRAWTRKMRFSNGAAAGNISEVGIYSNNAVLVSRALVKDGNGDPTTITILNDESLDVDYEFRIYPPTSDSNFQTDISGTTYDVLMRAGNVGQQTAWGMTQYGASSPFSRRGRFSDNNVHAILFDGTLGTITGQPSGSQDGSNTRSVAGYVDGTYERDWSFGWDLNDGNVGGGSGGPNILAFGGHIGSGGYFQCEFTPRIPKDNTKILDLNVRQSWGRYVAP